MTQGPYHLISIGILLILSYLLSLLMVRLQLLSSQNHKRFWNSLLLLFFVSTAILGLMLAVKVNYKLNVEWIDTAMQWHVDLGIGFASVSAFHLTWHLGFYKKALQRKASVKSTRVLTPHLPMKTWQVRSVFIMLGFISIMAQLVMLREFLKTLQGNELIIGIFLATWMMLTGAGAWAGSSYNARISRDTLLKLVLSLAAFPMVAYFALVLVTRMLFLPGYEPGMFSSICYMVLLIILFTMTSGFLFAYLSRAVKGSSINASYYMLDSLGSLAAGVVFGLVLVFFFENLQVLAILFLSSAASVILVFRFPVRSLHRFILLAAGALLLVALLVPGMFNTLEEIRFRNESVLISRDTPYGNLTYTTMNQQVNVYLDRNPLPSSSDLARAEETVHYPALQRPSPGSFLVIGGGLQGLANEVGKYEPGRFDYCEINPWIHRLGQQFLPFPQNDSVRVLETDGRSWLMQSETAPYDVIISLAGDPLTIGWNRYFTDEFYTVVRSKLTPGGVFCMQLSVSGNYINDVGNHMLSINYKTLKKSFKYVVPVPGYSTYFLASQEPLSLDFPGLLREQPVPTTYVHPDYLDASRIAFDQEQIMERLDPEQARINSDFWPVLFFSGISNWRSKVGGSSLWVTGLVSMLVFMVLFFSYTPLKSGLYIAGFTGAGIQILLIMVLQSLYGYAYLVAPIMITVFMGGIVTGTLTWKLVWRTPSLSRYTILLWIMAVLCAAGVVFLKTEQLFIHRATGQLLLGLLNFIPGIIVGSVYGVSLALSEGEGASGMGMLYSADLAGAAMGSFIPALFILPLIGVTNTFILFCGINVATGLYLLTRLQRR